MTEKLNTKFVTPEIVCSYPHLAEPDDPFQSGSPKYSLSVMIKKDDKESLSAIQQCIINAAVNSFGEKARDLKGLALPLTNSDDKDGKNDDPVYKDTFYFNAKSTRQPGLVDIKLQPILDAEEIYPGCIIRASMTFFGYNFNGKKGVSCGLQNVMKVRDGERIGGTSDAKSDFAGFYPNAAEGKTDMFGPSADTPF